MATINIGNATQIGALSQFELAGEPRVISRSSTGFTYADNSGLTVSGGGNGLVFDAQGDWIGGIVNSINISKNGNLIFNATGLAVDGNSTAYDTGFGGYAPGIESEVAYWLRGSDFVAGSTGNEVLKGYGGNDAFIGGIGNDVIDGGTGIDTALYSGNYSAQTYSVTKASNGAVLVNDLVAGRDGSDALYNVERIKFADKVVAFDTTGVAGQAYRLYQAAFDRKPDSAGLGYWVGILDSGHSLLVAADAFLNSTEFQTLYGAAPTNAFFVDKLYRNILHRAPEADGYNYWVNILEKGIAGRAQVLAEFSESAENKAALELTGVYKNGIEFTPYG